MSQRSDIMPKVTERASEIMNRVTEGKYAGLTSGENLELSVSISDERKSVDFLSDGTKDAAFVSLRASLVETMFQSEVPAMIFDECFARMDSDRLKGLLAMMSQEDFPQSFVFTCRSLEGESAPDANLILM